MNRQDLIKLLQGYIGLTPQDKGLISWNQMQQELADRILTLNRESQLPTRILSRGTKVFVDTKTISASCNISKTKHQKQTIIETYNPINNTYGCKGIREVIAEFQLTPIE